MTKSYKLKTIKDIFDKVPIDRISHLFVELRELMMISDIVRSSEGVEVSFPEEIIWNDDGKGDVVVEVITENSSDHVCTIKSKIGDGL